MNPWGFKRKQINRLRGSVQEIASINIKKSHIKNLKFARLKTTPKTSF